MKIEQELCDIVRVVCIGCDAQVDCVAVNQEDESKSKKYTAQEMREMADNLDSVYVAPECEDKKEQYGYLSMASMMLRQSADMMDQERKYEYARVLPDGSISCTHFDEYAKGYYKFRREVGEWEEVSNG